MVDLGQQETINIMENFKKIQVKSASFISTETETDIVHIIKTGFSDTYLVIYEDAYGASVGTTLIKNAEEIRQKFNIDIEYEFR